MSDCSTKKIYTGGRVVGEVVGEVFKKNISGSRHILHKPRAIALSVESLTQAEKVGAQEIQITDKESGALYACPFERFKEFARRYESELSDAQEDLEHIRHIAKNKKVCLLYGAKDEEFNQAVVLQRILKYKQVTKVCQK